jgi:hypothetical protein
MQRTRSALGLGAITVALIVVGCGSSKSSTSAPAASSTASTAATTSTGTASKPDQFRDRLINHSGFTPQQADCIVNAVLKRIGRARFDRLYGTSNVPSSVQTVIFSASTKCAPRGAGQ